MKDTWIWWSLVSQAVLLTYCQIIEWVDLFPWNNIRGGNGQETLDFIVGGVVVLFIVAAALRLWRVMFLGAVVYTIWLGLEIDSWWIAYLKGASPSWKAVYQRNFADTVKFLPTRGGHLAPDAAHVFLQLLIVIAMVTTIAAAFRIRSQRIARATN